LNDENSLKAKEKKIKAHVYVAAGGLAACVEGFRLDLRSLLERLDRPTVAGELTDTGAPAVRGVELATCDRLLWLASRNCFPCARWGWRNAFLWSSVMPWACFLARL
jgi:hypothetical protein